MAEKQVHCLLLGWEIPESRCDVKRYKKTIPLTCKECWIQQKEKRIEGLEESVKSLRRKTVALAVASGRREVLIEDEIAQRKALKERMGK
ncbi:MAG: hypothetical protein JRD68_00260 [Deltaproteobacteria bacterium]|nr:hypothetical protein [Deltaproteobacteria bacterium]